MKTLNATFRELDNRRYKTPVYLVTLEGEGQTQRMAVFRKNITYGGNTYTAGGISIGSFSASSDLTPESLNLTVKSNNNQFASYLLQSRIPLVRVVITKTFYEDLTVGSDIFVGRVRSIAADSRTFTLNCISILSLLDNQLIRVITRTSCNHRLYDPGCGILKTSSHNAYPFRHTESALSVDDDRRVMTFSGITSSYPTGSVPDFFTDGTAEYNDGNYIRKTYILKQDGNTIYLLSTLGVIAGQVITLTAGCQFSHDVCNSRFGNRDKILAFPLIPIRNPSTDGASQ